MTPFTTSAKPTSPPPSPSLFDYNGEGTLYLKDKGRVDCHFEASQLKDGTCLLLCHTPAFHRACLTSISARSFAGTTASGHSLVTQGPLVEYNYLGDYVCGPGTYFAFRCRQIYIHHTASSVSPHHYTFGLTNLRFIGTEWRSDASHHYLSLPLTLLTPSGAILLELHPVPDYKKTALTLCTLKNIDVTCEIHLHSPHARSMSQAETIISDLCLLLSLAHGTQVEWVYYKVYGNRNELARTRHCSRITKPYSCLHLIDPHSTTDMKHFVESSYARYKELEAYSLPKLIRHSVDARSEGDYLELRTLKTVLILELLVRNLTRKCNWEKTYLPTSQVKSLKSSLEGALGTLQIDEATRDAILEKVSELNRRPFRYFLTELCSSFNVSLNVTQLVRSRNELVHNGRLLCEATSPATTQAKWKEYTFVVNSVDRILLRLLGYDGFYVNCTNFKRERVN